MPGITLQALSEAHIPAVIEACANWPELATHGAPYWRPRSAAELQRRVASTAGPSLAAEYSLVITEGDLLLGECSVHAIDWRNRVAQVAVCIWDPANRGRGRGPESLRQLARWTTGYLGLRRLEAWILEGNEPSMRMVTAQDFSREGILRRRYLDDGQWRDVHVFAYLADE